MNFDSTADDGNSLATSLWHKGGFKTRPYKLRDCDVLPVRGLRDACHMRSPCLKGEGGRAKRIPHLRATRAALPRKWGRDSGRFAIEPALERFGPGLLRRIELAV